MVGRSWRGVLTPGYCELCNFPSVGKYSHLFLKNWSIVALQCCFNFCYTMEWISYRYTYICLPSWTSFSHPSPPQTHPSRSWQSTKLSSLLYSRFPLTINILHIVVDIHQSWSPSWSHSPLLPVHPHVCSPCQQLYSCPANRFICTIFRNFTYMC